MSTYTEALPLPFDDDGRKIQAGSVITGVVNLTISTVAYAAIIVPDGVYCKGFLIKTRNGSAYRLSNSGTPTAYIKISNPLSFDMVLAPGDTAFYVRADSVTDTLEILYLD